MAAPGECPQALDEQKEEEKAPDGSLPYRPQGQPSRIRVGAIRKEMKRALCCYIMLM